MKCKKFGCNYIHGQTFYIYGQCFSRPHGPRSTAWIAPVSIPCPSPTSTNLQGRLQHPWRQPPCLSRNTMAGVGNTQQSIRKALGVLKDTTTVGLVKVNSDYKDLDTAIVKATNHVEHLVKEKHIKTIFDAVSASRPRADVAYCINALARRLARTHNWAVALKTLIVLHRALREVDPTFQEELTKDTKTRGFMMNLSHFKDASSPSAWDYSAWVRTYALYLEERLECFRVLKYDVEAERCRIAEAGTTELLDHLPALQQLLFRLLGCQPEGATTFNYVIRYALSMVAGESIKIYSAINCGTLHLVDKFFEMPRHDAVRAIEIYKKTGSQAERLSKFYEICKGLEIGTEENFAKIEQPPASFVAAMEDYVKELSRAMQNQSMDEEANLESTSAPPEPPAAEAAEAPAHSEPTDLMRCATISSGSSPCLSMAPPANVQMAAMAEQQVC